MTNEEHKRRRRPPYIRMTPPPGTHFKALMRLAVDGRKEGYITAVVPGGVLVDTRSKLEDA